MPRIAVSVQGIVQGVGFRPFLHRLCTQLGLTGWGCNTAFGVSLEVQGSAKALKAFETRLTADAPALAVIEHVETRSISAMPGETGFTIRESKNGAHNTLVAPDSATCPDCLRELHDPADRRYRYPFINCTNCGPRFTIIKTVPYDRKNTTMASFSMCPACAAEYGDIHTRRYHAQPDCCPVCGPQLWFTDENGVRQTQPGAFDEAIRQAQALLCAGKILAVKGLGGFHLACLPSVAQMLRARKHREEKPFALMCPDAEAVKAFCRVSDAEKALLESRRRPIVLLQKNDPAAWQALSENNELGVLLPYTPVHTLLFEAVPGVPAPDFSALIMTSANRSDLPVVTDNAAAIQALRGIADGFLLNDREIDARCDDSLMRIFEVKPYFIRRSRGYTPEPLPLPFSADGIFAAGAELKAGFALGKENKAFLSQHIGDLKNAETLEHYQLQAARFSRLFGAPICRLVCDEHPDYLSSIEAKRYAAQNSLPLCRVQHHHAHFAACLADNALPADTRAIGIVWDGTGRGTDGTIWGGEWFIGGYAEAERAASLRPIRLLGGDKAVLETGRTAFCLARDAGVCDGLMLDDATRRRWAALYEARLNCPESSGMGRLFDGVYSLLTGRLAMGYEGQAPVLLETLAQQADAEKTIPTFPVVFSNDAAGLPRLDTRPMIQMLLAKKAAGVDIETLALAFHRYLADAACKACLSIREKTGLCHVALSGGCFLNVTLTAQICGRLRDAGFTVYLHRHSAPSDESIALGQLAVAAVRLKKE